MDKTISEIVNDFHKLITNINCEFIITQRSIKVKYNANREYVEYFHRFLPRFHSSSYPSERHFKTHFYVGV